VLALVMFVVTVQLDLHHGALRDCNNNGLLLGHTTLVANVNVDNKEGDS